MCQDDDDETEKKLCADKSAGELFRLKEGKDNCRDILHDDRWNLRPILEHPKKWYHRVKVKWPEVIRNIDLEFMGADLKINARTIASRHDRSIFIEAKHLFPKNHNVEARPSITKSSMRQGKLEHATEYDYQDPETLEEMLTAVANLAAIDHRLWNQDYTAHAHSPEQDRSQIQILQRSWRRLGKSLQ